MRPETETRPINVTFRDESIPRSEVIESILQIRSMQLTARDLIAERVRAECDKRPVTDVGPHAPQRIERSAKEKALNGKVKPHVLISANSDDFQLQQIEIALTAFERNGLILLVDGTQIEDLDAVVQLNSSTVVTFLKLTPLVGG